MPNCDAAHTATCPGSRISANPCRSMYITGDVAVEYFMNKLIGIVLVVYLIGDPDLSMLEGLNVAREYVITTMLMVVSAPWIRAQFDS